MLIFRQLFDPQSSTYTYLLGDDASNHVTGAWLLMERLASEILQQAGLPNVANLAGGILRWRAQHLTVVGGSVNI